MVRRSRNTIQQWHGKFAESSLTSAKLSPRQSRAAPASLGVHSCSSADSGRTEGAPSLFAEVVIKYRDAPARGEIGVAVPLKIIAPPCRSDRLHSGFNLVRPLLRTIYADERIYRKALHIETRIRTKLRIRMGWSLFGLRAWLDYAFSNTDCFCNRDIIGCCR